MAGYEIKSILLIDKVNKRIYEAVAESPFPPTISACPTDGVLIPLGQAI